MADRWGSLELDVEAPGPTATVLSVHDADGRLVARRRLRTTRCAVPLPAGRLRVTLDDERSLHDPSRFATVTDQVEVAAGRVTPVTLRLGPPQVVRGLLLLDGAPARFARIHLEHADGTHLEARATGEGRVVLAGLRTGAWTLRAADSRRRRARTPLPVQVAAGVDHDLTLELGVATAGLAVCVRVDGRSVRTAPHGSATGLTATVTLLHHETGAETTARVVDGVASVRGLWPGRHRLRVSAGLGHLGAETTVDVGPGGLTWCEVSVPAGALLTGRVVQGGPQPAAVVTLLDGEGRELERTRTDATGRYELGVGLGATDDLTVVATSGPNTLHVTRAARAEVRSVPGVRHDLGDLRLPVVGAAAAWAPRCPAAPVMRLPSTRL